MKISNAYRHMILSSAEASIIWEIVASVKE